MLRAEFSSCTSLFNESLGIAPRNVSFQLRVEVNIVQNELCLADPAVELVGLVLLLS